MPEDLHSIKCRLDGAFARVPYLTRSLALLWGASRGFTLAWVILLLAQGLLPVATVYLTRSLVNALAGASADRVGQGIRPALATAAILGGVLLLAALLRVIGNWVRAAQSERVQDHVTRLIHEKSLAVDLAFYETPDFYDRLHRARAEAGSRPIALLESLGSLFQNGVTLLGMAAVLIPYGAWLPAALLVSTLPALCVVLHSSWRHHRWYLRTTADERRTRYYDWMLTSGETAAEVRLLGIGRHFRSAYQLLRARLRRERLDLKRKQSLYELGAGTAALGVTGGALAWMAWRTLQGFGTLGDVALFYQAFSQGQQLMRTLLESAGQIFSNALYLGGLFDFLALKPAVIDPPKPVRPPASLRCGICFAGVTFRYPGSARAALRDFDLIIPAGRITAIVGPNGAGKSTLIKLICRLYDPCEGQIELDAVDIRQFGIEELRRRMSVLLQMPVRYSATARENIALGDLRSFPREEEVVKAARAAGADSILAALPEGYGNMLGRWFEGGTELSAGEWQRIALARAFLRQAPILLLDEPTHAMDPWAEADWLARFRNLAAGRTAVLVTHRLTAAMIADCIHVMEEGRVVESGTHGQLLAGHGRYAESWLRQSEASACVL